MPIFDFNSAQKSSSLVRELAKHVNTETLHHEGGDNSEWARAQIEMLTAGVPKAKYIENLLKAIVDENPVSPCCPVATKKSRMSNQCHIYSIKLFRFSFVSNNSRLKSMNNCQYPPTNHGDSLCINPYHYDMMKPNIPVPPVHVDTGSIQPGLAVPQKIMDHCYQHLQVGLHAQGPPTAFISGDELNEHLDNAAKGLFMPQPQDFFLPDANAPTKNQIFTEAHVEQMSPSFGGRFTASPGSPNSFLTEDDNNSLNDEPMDTASEVPKTLAAALPLELQSQLKLPLKVVKMDVAYREPEHWVSITYYERSRRIGAPVDCVSPYVLIDGFTKPYTSSRVSLGYFSNPGRDIGTSRALLFMGRGCRLYYLGGEVYLECLSQYPIYVQSPNCNQRHGWHAATVVQVPSGCNLKIFSYAEFSSQLAECVKYGFDTIYALSRLCTIRVSFVKGWGSAFRRQQVTNTPIWVEAHLNGALEWVDNVLSTMGCPSKVCSSFS